MPARRQLFVQWKVGTLRTSFNGEDVREVLIRAHADGLTVAQSLGVLIGREPTSEEWGAFDRTVERMRDGWVRMNENARRFQFRSLALKWAGGEGYEWIKASYSA